MGAPQRYTARPVPQPVKKMKQLFWDTIPYARLHGTFWVEPDPDEAAAAAAAATAAAADQSGGEADGGEEGRDGPPTLDWSLMEDMFAQVGRGGLWALGWGGP